MSDEKNPTPEIEAVLQGAEFESLDDDETIVVLDDIEVPAADLTADMDEDLTADMGDDEGAVAGAESDDEDNVAAPSEYQERERGDRSRPGTDIRVDDINYKNISLLSRFLDRRGRIMSRRKTRVSAKVQRRVVREIKRARHLALLPYTADQTRQVRRRK
ncbi:MAG: 30S ribosomal protein S18 [Caldilineaceae bacterium]|nr:30S ribosomal protein S18 [Caldilineaceae bacterium]